MDHINDAQNFFLENGYVKFNNKSSISYQLIRDVIATELEQYGFDFESIHKKIKIDELNNVRMNIFNKINSIKNWEDHLYSIGGEVISKIIGNEISIQNKLNFSIQMPGDKLSQIPMHTDRAGGHSLFECVLWIAFTTSNKTSSMYIVDPETSISILNELPNYELNGINLLEKKYLNKLKFIEVVPGDCILFSSNLYHGNVVNEEASTRISINCRFKSLWAPEYKKYPNERVTGSFYKPYKLSPVSIFASKFLNKEPKFV